MLMLGKPRRAAYSDGRLIVSAVVESSTDN